MNKFNCEFDRCLTDERGNLTISFIVKGTEKKKAMKCVQDILTLKNKGKERLTMEIKQWREKRSKRANDYCWKLIGKLSEKSKIGETPIDIYRKFIYELNIYKRIKVNEEASDTLLKIWQSRGIGWLAEKVDKIGYGDVLVHAYYGSSSFNTKQMYQFIQNIVNECKSYGIETRTPDEIDRMVSLHKAEV